MHFNDTIRHTRSIQYFVLPFSSDINCYLIFPLQYVFKISKLLTLNINTSCYNDQVKTDYEDQSMPPLN